MPEIIDVAGRRIRHMVVAGSDDAVVLVHGIGGNLGGWVLNQPVLAASGRTVASFDLPGHGESARELVSGSLEELSSTLLDYLTAIGIASAHLVGHSMGAAICLDAARRRPARVRSLVLVSPAGLGSPPNLEWARRLITTMDSAALMVVARESVGDPEMISPPMIEDLMRYKHLDGTVAAQLRILESVYGGGDVDPRLRQVLDGLSALVIWGGRDIVLPALDAQQVRRTNVEFHLFPQCGHQVTLEAAADVNRLIEHFLDRVERHERC